MFDITELIKRIIKYLIEGLMVAIAAFAIPKRSLNLEEMKFSIGARPLEFFPPSTINTLMPDSTRGKVTETPEGPLPTTITSNLKLI